MPPEAAAPDADEGGWAPAPGARKRPAITTGISGKSHWHLARSQATQIRMSNGLKVRGLPGIRDLWMKAHGYA